MRLKIIIALGAVALSGQAAAATWRLMYDGDKATRHYDVDTIGFEDGYIVFWDRTEYKGHQDDRIYKSVARQQWDCKGRRHRSLYTIDYGMDGSIIKTWPNPTAWVPVIPESNGERMQSVVCSSGQ